jgi:hypothetical protein
VLTTLKDGAAQRAAPSQLRAGSGSAGPDRTDQHLKKIAFAIFFR